VECNGTTFMNMEYRRELLEESDREVYPDEQVHDFINKQTKICRPTEYFNVTSHSATCFGSHEPSSGTSFYRNLKYRGAFERTVIL
jgi:hypothetical protein